MLQAFLAAFPRDTSAFTITRVHCNCRHAVDKLDHSWNPGKNFPVLFKLNFPLLQPDKLHSGKYFLKISKPQQVQSLNYMYYSKNRGKLIDSIMGLFSHDPFFGLFVFTFDSAAKPWYKYRLFSILTWRRDWISFQSWARDIQVKILSGGQIQCRWMVQVITNVRRNSPESWIMHVLLRLFISFLCSCA